MRHNLLIAIILIAIGLTEICAQTDNTFTDSRDGSVYQTVTIGKQVWMAENLKYLPSVVGSATGSGTTPYYYVYGYEGTNVEDAQSTANYAVFGVLYNWPAAMAGSIAGRSNPSGGQGVCPTGWHLPNDAEWTELFDYLGGIPFAGGKLKEIGTNHWISPNAAATNETGFTALPGGRRVSSGAFESVGENGYWWGDTDVSIIFAKYWIMYNSNSSVFRMQSNKAMGLSVRCVKDN